MIYKTRICSSETMVFNLIHERGNLQSHLTSYYEEVLLWLSKRITVQALHPISQLRFFRGRCKTQHNTCPLTVQYYTTMEKKSFKVGSTQFLTSIFLLYFFRGHANLHMVLFSKTNASTFFLVAQLQLYKNKPRERHMEENQVQLKTVQKAASSKSINLKLI